MQKTSSTFSRWPTARAAQSGSAMVTSLLTVFILSLVAANVISSISSRYNSAYRSASWNEALVTADSGVDIALCELVRKIPDVTASSATGLGVGYSQPPSVSALTGLQFLPTGTLPTGTLVSFTPDSMNHLGEGGTVQQATVSLDVVLLSDLLKDGVSGVVGTVNATLNTATSLLGGGDVQLLRIRSVGTVQITGGRNAGPSRLDNDLWRPSLLTDRLSGAAITTPTISRQVEVLLRPVHPYEAAVVSDDVVLATDQGTIFDSFNSLVSTASTNGKYDSFKRLSNGSVRANGSTCSVGGTVYGDVGTNGTNAGQIAHATGAVSSSSYVPLSLVNAPSWAGFDLTTATFGGLFPAPAGLVTPTQYRSSGIAGTVRISGVGSAEIYIDGDLTGSLVVDPTVKLKVYISGSINTKASKILNGSGLAANLQIYGVYKSSNGAPTIRLNADAPLAAAIYAPGHKIYLNGSSDFSGSIVGSRFEATDAVRVHYDESLAYNSGPLLRYQIASWREITN